MTEKTKSTRSQRNVYLNGIETLLWRAHTPEAAYYRGETCKCAERGEAKGTTIHVVAADYVTRLAAWVVC